MSHIGTLVVLEWVSRCVMMNELLEEASVKSYLEQMLRMDVRIYMILRMSNRKVYSTISSPNPGVSLQISVCLAEVETNADNCIDFNL